jgi:electron transfer flavoprotein alpha subunit
MILAILENAGQKLPKGTLCTIQAALEAKKQHGYAQAIGLVIGGPDAAQAAASAAGYGLDQVCYVADSALDQYLALPYAAAAAAAIAELKPELVLALASSRGKDLLPRIAQPLEAGQASDVIGFLADKVYRRPMYAGNVIADVKINSTVHVVSVRASAFAAAATSSSSAPVRELKVALPSTSSAQSFVSFETVKSERPELTEAEIVVSGGRALKSSENFQTLIAPLADALGAAVGASRAAVDSGYAPNDWQVGQTGKIVAPSLYLAVGISGAIQHLAGMKDSKFIAAVNKDPEAPIFEIADYGLVADLFEAVPALTAEIKRVKGG